MMAQLITNQDDTMLSYKLMVVCSLEGILEAECYDSSTCTWSKMNDGFICGCDPPIQNMGDLCTFNCAQGTITEMTSFESQSDFKLDMYTSYRFQDRTFVMKKNQEAGPTVQLLDERGYSDVNLNSGSKYELVEFQMDSNKLVLKRRKSYVCPLHPFNSEIDALNVLVCGNFIFIISAIPIRDHDLIWLYDMSKDVWRVLPRLPDNVLRDPNKLICEL